MFLRFCLGLSFVAFALLLIEMADQINPPLGQILMENIGVAALKNLTDLSQD